MMMDATKLARGVKKSAAETVATPVRGSNVIVSSVGMVKVTPITTSSPQSPSQFDNTSGDPNVIVAYIWAKFGTGWQGQVAQCIARHESGYNQYAVDNDSNGTVDRGIFQINSVHGYASSILFDWQSNVDIAYDMSGGGNDWNAWATKRYCI